jgi:AraC-like DNA-binding protein/mannose-6-phosphate isomerase-like protein (cupin superfamily)
MMCDQKLNIEFAHMPRPMASAEAWVYTVKEEGRPWGTFVDEKIRYKTLFEPGSFIHEDLDEVIVPLEGRYWVRIGDWSRTLGPGEAGLIPRNTPHDSGTATNLVGTHFLVLLFDPRLCVLKANAAGGIALPDGCLAWLKGIFRFLRNSPNEMGLHGLIQLAPFFEAASRRQKLAADNSHPDPVVARLIRLLETSESVSLDDLASEAGLSPTHIQKRFRKALGSSPLQYANAWKLDQIADQLVTGNTLPLVELATEYGFNDQKHFRELFQRRFGVTPSAYRKNPPPPKK